MFIFEINTNLGPWALFCGCCSGWR